MALFNTNSAPSPFGSSSATPTPDVGAQFFLGCTVVDFNINADFASQGGSLSVTIIEDANTILDYNSTNGTWHLGATYAQKIRDTTIYDYATGTTGSLPVIGSPQHFRLLDTSGNIIFQYDGILTAISRAASPGGGKKYVVELGSPLKLLESCAMVLANIPGYGHSIEGIPSGISTNGYYQNTEQTDPFYFGVTDPLSGSPYQLKKSLESHTPGIGVTASTIDDSLSINEIYDKRQPPGFAVAKDFTNQDVGTSFGSNNNAIDWANLYNLQNVFGIFENESDGLAGYAKFGGSRSASNGDKDQGLRLDMVALALDELINRNPSSSTSKKKFGGNIISGTTTYNFYDVAVGNVASNPYFYGFDVYSFTNYMINRLGADYIYTGNISSNVLEFVSTLCDDAGIDFIVELNRIQTSDIAGTNYWDGTDTVSNYSCPGSLYDGGTFHLEKSYANSVPGGIVSIKVLDRRTLSFTDPANIRTPFSKVAYHILGYESPDFGDKGSARMNPGDPNPFSNAFEIGAFGNTYLDPLDDDYTLKGTDGSSPYGGKFPVAKTTDMNLADDPYDLRTNASQTNIKIQDNQQVTAKFVVGGKQSRIVKVPREYIYQYWGEVSIQQTGDRNKDEKPEFRKMPVVTPFLEELDVVDFILIDMRSIFDEESTLYENNLTNKGVYSASVVEIRAAMTSYKEWEEFFFRFKSCAIFGFMKSLGFSIEYIGKFLSSFTMFETTEEGVDATKRNRERSSQENDSPTDEPEQKEETASGDSWVSKKIFWDVMNKMHAAIKKIGDEHYGKSWAVWTPQATVNLPEGNVANGAYDFSWNPVDDAYLEPSVYDDFGAPISQKFLNGNRLQGWSLYPTKVGHTIIDRERNLQGLTPIGVSAPDKLFHAFQYPSGPDKGPRYDFSNVQESDFSQTRIESRYDFGTTNVKIKSDPDFLFVPYDYFKYYSRDRKMFFDIEDVEDPKFYDIDYTGHYCAVQYAGIAVESGYNLYADAQINNKTGQDIVSNSYLPSAIDYLKYDPVGTGISLRQTANNAQRIMCETGVAFEGQITAYDKYHANNAKMVEDFCELAVPDHGLNSITFTKITTPFIGFPAASGNSISQARLSSSIDIAFRGLLNATAEADEDTDPNTKRNRSAPKKLNLESVALSPPCVGPHEVGLPQQSTRHHYGPWFTTHNFIYGGKVEYLQEDELVPENHIYPLYGGLSSPDTNAPIFSGVFSGFHGMNMVGQSIANSIDGYGQFAAEDGSVTIPGAPIISRIGDALFTNGPYITSMSVSAGAQGITTKYVFNSVNNRTGKTNNDIVRKIQRLSGKIASNAGNSKKGRK